MMSTYPLGVKILLLVCSLALERAESFAPVVGISYSSIAKERQLSDFDTSLNAIAAATVCKDELLNALSSTPSGMPTPQRMTNSILRLVKQLEIKCPTPDDEVLPKSGGSWELLWTAQDPNAAEANQFFINSWITPLENQSYSNNPKGRSNPFLPVGIQERLEALGLVSATPVRSTQAVDLRRGEIRNIVALNFGTNGSKIGSATNQKTIVAEERCSRTFAQPFSSTSLSTPTNQRKLDSLPTRASVTVTIDFKPVASDPRTVDVKFTSFRISVPGTPIEWNIPLGLAGPGGWLKTVYVDEDLRISRGHKGSVFVLSRPRRATV